MTMLSKGAKSKARPAEFWGQSKGYIRQIEIKGHSAVYVIEESPGYRTIRYNRRKYRVFCPWVYFFVRIQANLVVESGGFYAFFSRKRLETLDQQGLSIAPFSNTTAEGSVCLPVFKPISKVPIELALESIWYFWVSNGSEFSEDLVCELPPGIKTNFSGERFGSILSWWAKMSPKQVVNLEFCAATYGSISEACSSLRFYS